MVVDVHTFFIKWSAIETSTLENGFTNYPNQVISGVNGFLSSPTSQWQVQIISLRIYVQYYFTPHYVIPHKINMYNLYFWQASISSK